MRSVLVRPRTRRARAFTLPELMAVVAIIGVMGAIAMATLSRSGDAENAAALARSLQFAIANARSSTISDGIERVLQCDPQSSLQSSRSYCVINKACAPGMILPDICPWITEQKITASSHATLWNITLTNDRTQDLSGGSQSSVARTMYMRPDGTVCDVVQTASAPSTACNSDGFTYYVADKGGSNKSNHYKVYVYGLTGMPRLVNNW